MYLNIFPGFSRNAAELRERIPMSGSNPVVLWGSLSSLRVEIKEEAVVTCWLLAKLGIGLAMELGWEGISSSEDLEELLLWE